MHQPKKSGSRPENKGHLEIHNPKIIRKFTFIDFISGGTEINLMIVIFFSKKLVNIDIYVGYRF